MTLLSDPDAYERWKDDQQEADETRLPRLRCGCQPWRNGLGNVVMLECADHKFLIDDNAYQAQLERQDAEIQAAAEAAEQDAAEWRFKCTGCGVLTHYRDELCPRCAVEL